MTDQTSYICTTDHANDEYLDSPNTSHEDTNGDVKFFDLSEQERHKDQLNNHKDDNMDIENSENSANAQELSNYLGDNGEQLFDIPDFTNENTKNLQSRALRMQSIGIYTCDSWMIEDLYCDGLTMKECDYDTYTTKHALLSWATYKLSDSPTAKKMLAEAEEQGWAVALESLDGHDFHIDVPERLILIDDQNMPASFLGRSEYFKNTIVMTLIRALRDIWHEKRQGAFDDLYGPDAVLMLERVRAADLDILAVLVGWELRQAGDMPFWRFLIGTEEGDIAILFGSVMEQKISKKQKAKLKYKALSASFTQWFRDSSRINACDHETLNYMDLILQETNGYDVFGFTKLHSLAIEIVSCLPDKTAYLQGRGDEVLCDPLYAGLCNEINQAHYMQISNDLAVTRVQDVPFRNAALAAKIFPNGQFTGEEE